MSDDLIVWLRGVLDEDERDARAVQSAEIYDVPASTDDAPEAAFKRLDTDAWLADIAAKRAVLDLHGWESHECPEPSDEWGPHTGYEPICRTVRLLASAHAERPGYREEWAPEYLSTTEGRAALFRGGAARRRDG